MEAQFFMSNTTAIVTLAILQMSHHNYTLKHSYNISSGELTFTEYTPSDFDL